MGRIQSRADRISVAIIVLTAVGSLVLWPRLPAEMAIHFSVSGRPDNFVPRAVGIGLLPVIMAGTLLIMKVAMRYDPPEDPQVPGVVTVATTGFLAALHALVLAWNLGYPVPFDLVLVGSLVWAALLCGYAFRREGISIS